MKIEKLDGKIVIIRDYNLVNDNSYTVNGIKFKSRNEYKKWLQTIPLKKKIELRFFNKVDKKSNDDCWIWKGAIAGERYGYMLYNGKLEYAHRISFLIFNGEIVKDKEVCHICDNSLCVNPKHLFLGTHKDNIRQMYDRNRDNNILSFDDATKIRKIYNDDITLTQDNLAKEYGVSRGEIASILRNEAWIDKTYKSIKRAYNIESSKFAKLTWKDVEEIRNKYSTHKFTQLQLAKEYGVIRDTIADIIYMRTWKK